MRKSLLGLALVVSACAFFEPSPAEACGGCFVPQQERTVVTDHRMALSISPEQTVLWDQIRYSGDPAEFAWVLPVRPGAKLSLSNDEWFTALDASTQPVIYQPNNFGGAYGCALTGCGSQESASAYSDGVGPGQVQVLSQQVVGPYETVTLRATDDDALRSWLKSHAYSIPDSIAPTIDAYVAEGFDFIALRLRPGCGERSMQPVRVVTKGADPTLPLRMVAAGVGPRVGITLYVITEGRWQPRNFESTVFDDDRLRWDRYAGKSNYEEISQELMAADDGRTWLTEYADRPQLYWSGSLTSPSTGARRGPNPGLTDSYFGLCKRWSSPSSSSSSSSSSGSSGSTFTPCPRGSADAGVDQDEDAGPDPQQQEPEDAGSDASIDPTGDAGADASTEADADAGEPDGSTEPDAGAPAYDPGGDLVPPYAECQYLDDLDVALVGLHRQDVWVTRLRAVLPADALSTGDLRLEPSPKQTPVSNVHYALYYADEDSAGRTTSKSSCLSSPKEHRAFGSWAFGATAAVLVVAWARRRRR